MAHLLTVLNAKKSPDQAGLVVGEGRGSLLEAHAV